MNGQNSIHDHHWNDHMHGDDQCLDVPLRYEVITNNYLIFIFINYHTSSQPNQSGNLKLMKTSQIKQDLSILELTSHHVVFKHQ